MSRLKQWWMGSVLVVLIAVGGGGFHMGGMEAGTSGGSRIAGNCPGLTIWCPIVQRM